MIRAIRWLWLVLPRGWVVAVFAAFYVAHELLWLWISSGTETREATDQLWKQRNNLMVLACAAYGIFRAAAFHPLFRPEYSKWLEVTPWTSRKPLPAGPIHWVPQDAVVLGTCLALLHTHEVVLLQVVMAFAFAYQTALAPSLWATGVRWRCYAILFVLGGVVWLVKTPPAALAVLVALYPFTYLSLLRSLDRFPWQLPEWWPRPHLKPQATREDRKASQKGLGWPYDMLQPVKPKMSIDFEDGVAVSLLMGWWVYAIAANFPEENRFAPAILVMVATPYLGMYRLALYCGNHWWPITLWGRLCTGRWIVPRFDWVLVSPLLATLIPPIGLLGTMAFHVDTAAGTGICVALAMGVLLNMGPTLADWQLTGSHRIVPGLTNKRDFVQL